ncbi:MAG: hypothetical protein KatS3mg044_0831 [Rhodothermaceae bacterium]|nr:MAG: hypothetical protein D6746_02305 [Bacteroidota bacterium]GIV61965.1 MAG: hypothetical protein KatS3mg044_0831 [Rhodothermaceae bacterium]
MKARTRSALILVVTLLVGVALGALGASALYNHRLEKLRELGRPAGFSMHLERVIEPVDEAQRQQIRDVLEDAGRRLSTLRRAHQAEYRAVIDSTRAALDSLLTPAQKERLERWLERDRRMFRRRPAPGMGPPPGHRFERAPAGPPEGPPDGPPER